jgi:hypothetical protein
MHARQLITSLSIATAVTACSSSPDPNPDPLPLASSFDLTATLTFSDGTDPYGLPGSERLVLRLDDAPDGTVAAVWGANVGSYLGTFTRTEEGLSSQSLLALRVEPQESGSFDPSIWLRTVDLVLIDRDDDGEVDAVEGTGTGEFHQLLGDVEQTQPFTVELRGDLDATPPVLAIDGDTAAFNVLDQLRIVTSEPLDPATTAVLSYGDTRVVLEQGPGASPYARSFGANTLLPFGTDLRVEFDPAPRDLAGLTSENVPTTVRTMAAPGLFSEDGFEGELVAVTRGAEVVAGVGTLPAITGARSLLIETGDTLTMRIPLAGGETHLRFQARILTDGAGFHGCTGIEVRAGFPGLPDGSNIAGLYVLLPGDFDENTGDEAWPMAGPIISVEHALPAGATGEVIFDVFVPDLAGPCLNAAMLIDDLRAE